MSGFKVFSSGKDLDAIFEQRTTTDSSAQIVPFVTPAGQNLSDRYLKYTTGETKAPATGFKCFDSSDNLIDLNELYAKKLPNWVPLSQSISTVGGVTVSSISGYNPTNTLYVGGIFTTAGGKTVNRIAMWNGTAWNNMGNGVSGVLGSFDVKAIYALDPLYVYAGGRFTIAGTKTVSNIAMWNGNEWNDMAGGASSTVNAIDGYSINAVYVGGFFTTAGGTTVNRIAMWNGTGWSGMSGGITGGTTPNVYAISAINSLNVYVGGVFTTAGTTSVSNIAKWNGNTWSALSTGTTGAVSAIYAYDTSHVYVGGSFITAGGTTVNRIAMWNGISWEAMGSPNIGVNSSVLTIYAVDPSNVYVGGSFTTAGDVSCNRIAKWDGDKWNKMGTGAVQAVNATYVLNQSDVYIGGGFTTAGDVSCNYIAQYM